MRRFAFLAPLAFLALAACGGKDGDTDSDVAPGNFTRPARPSRRRCPAWRRSIR